MTTLTLESRITRLPAPVATEFDGEMVIMDIERGQYYGMARTARRIWDLIESGTTPARICRQLTEQYDVPEARCRQEVMAFLEKLLREQLIAAEASVAAASPCPPHPEASRP